MEFAESKDAKEASLTATGEGKQSNGASTATTAGGLANGKNGAKPKANMSSSSERGVEAAKASATKETSEEEPEYPCHLWIIIVLHAFFVGFQQSVLFPVIAYTITEDLQQSASWVGVAFFLFMFFAVMSIGVMMKLFGDGVTPRTITLWNYPLRLIAGLMYASVFLVDQYLGNAAGLAWLMLARVLHAPNVQMTLLSMSLVGTRLPMAKRATATADVQSVLPLGFILGPPTCALVARLFPGSQYQLFTNMGLIVAATSAFMWVVTYLFFDDYAAMPQKEDEAPEDPKVIKLIRTCALGGAFAFAGVVALESVMGLVSFDEFGMDPSHSWPIWLVISAADITGAMSFKFLNKFFGNAYAAPVLYLISAVGGASVINWLNPFAGVTLPIMLVGLLMKATGTVGSFIMLMSTVAERCPPHLIASGMAQVGMSSIFGRALAPVVTTWIYKGVQVLSPGTMLADNVALGTQYMYVLISFAIGICNWDLLFGSKEGKTDLN